MCPSSGGGGRFQGKVALVTGATSGIGQATAIRLAHDGAVVAVDQLPITNSDETLHAIEAVGGAGFPVVADVRNPEAVELMVAEVVERGGGLDLVVSNAAINPLKKWDEIDVNDFDDIQTTNLRGTWFVCQASAKQMVKQGRGGSIVTVSSISAIAGAEEQIVYCGTKAGVSMLTRALSITLGPHGIRCNTVMPGVILTGMSAELIDADSPARQYYLDRTPLRRIGEPSEVADVIAFLLSDDARFVTSGELLVDGGFVVNAE